MSGSPRPSRPTRSAPLLIANLPFYCTHPTPQIRHEPNPVKYIYTFSL